MRVQGDGGGRLQASGFDEDAGGPPTIILAGPGEKIGKIIDEFYSRIEATPEPGDRLECMATGEAVDPHRGEHISVYAAGHCGDLVWTFAADAGGARAMTPAQVDPEVAAALLGLHLAGFLTASEAASG